MAITALPAPPSRLDPANFATQADAFLGALPTFQTEANALQTDVNSKYAYTVTSADSAYTNSLNAAASALAAANSAGASIWVSGTTYAIGAARFSPLNYLTYRRKTAGAGTTDPSQDSTNWQLLTLDSTGLRNRIINGKMDIVQRGTSFTGIVSRTYTLDRWSFENQSSFPSIATISQQADIPTNEFNNSIRATVTNAQVTISADHRVLLTQIIEGYNVRDLIGKTFTLSFWVRSSKTGIHCISLQNSGIDRSYVTEYTVNVANTWEKKSITVTGGLLTAGTWNWTNGSGLQVNWTLLSGSTYQSPGYSSGWWAGNVYSTTNQVNCADTVGNIFAITGVQLEAGSSENLFDHRPYGMELALCQRYYNVIGSRGGDLFLYQAASQANAFVATIAYPVTMRTTPATTTITGTVTYTNASALNAVPTADYVALRCSVTAAGVYSVSTYGVTNSAEL